MAKAQVPAKDKVGELKALFEAVKPNIQRVLPQHLLPERILQIALASVSRNPLILQCTKESILQGVLLSSQLGLEIGGPLQQAHLVPFKNNKRGGAYEAQFIPGYRGLVELARRSGVVVSVFSEVVYDNDEFEWKIVNGELKFTHAPALEGDRGEFKGAYAAAKLNSGEVQGVYMRNDEIEKVRNSSRAKDSGPWVSWTDQMRKKTPLRRLCKLLPASVELATALTAEDRAEAGESTTDLVPEIPELTAHVDDRSKTAKVKDAIKAAKDEGEDIIDAVTEDDSVREPGEEG